MPGESWPKFPLQGCSLWPWTLCFNSLCLSASAARRSQIGYILNTSVERNCILQYVTGRSLLPGRNALRRAGRQTEAEAGRSWWGLPASSREACPQVAPGCHASWMWLFSVPSESGWGMKAAIRRMVVSSTVSSSEKLQRGTPLPICSHGACEPRWLHPRGRAWGGGLSSRAPAAGALFLFITRFADLKTL